MAFELRARIGLDNSPLMAGLEQSKRAVSQFGGAVRSGLGNELSALKGQFAAAFGIAAITGAIRGTVVYAGEVDNLAQQLDISAREAQKFLYVSEQTGSSVKKVMAAMGKEAKEFLLTQQQINAHVADFERMNLGIDDEDIARLDAVGDRLDQIHLKIKKIIASDITLGFLEFINVALSGGGASAGKAAANADLDMVANAITGVFAEIANKAVGTDKAPGEAGSSALGGATTRYSAVEKAKDELSMSFGRQFDSLARIGGLGQNTDQSNTIAIQDIRQHTATIAAAFKSGQMLSMASLLI